MSTNSSRVGNKPIVDPHSQRLVQSGKLGESPRGIVVIGLTGGIGTGKSTVAEVLSRLGAAIINADALGHEAYRPGTEGWRAIVKCFGESVLTPSREIDRKKLGRHVFADRSRLDQLNRIVHPLIAQAIQEKVQVLREQQFPAAVVDAAVLIEAGWNTLVDQVWVVVAPERVAVQRAAKRSGVAADSVRVRVQAQMSQEDRIKYADAVIDNSGSSEALQRQVQELWCRCVLSTRRK